jgi:hypothetical protein
MQSWHVVAGAIGLAALVAPQLSTAQPTGRAVAVVQQSLLAPAGLGRQPLSEGTPISLGDVVETGPSGEAQLNFEDDTKIVVGPNSRLLIEDALFPTDGTAERFAINALSGTFRFISGQSSSSAYSIRTPTATLAVRGTIADFRFDNVTGETKVALLEGEINLCPRGTDLKLEGGECVEVTGLCTVMTVKPSGEIIRHDDNEDKRRVLREFDYIQRQEGLLEKFRADTGACPVFAFIDPSRAAVIAAGVVAGGLIINEISKDDPPPSVPVSP